MNDKEIEMNKLNHMASPMPLFEEMRVEERPLENQAEVFKDRSRFVSLEEGDPKSYQEVMGALQQVMDPELGIDIVNLGLIYDVMADEDRNVFVIMTLTTPFCPLSDIIIEAVDQALGGIDSLAETGIELTFEPAWHPERLSRVARIALGFAPPQ